jgi:hypothetical protein
MAMAIMAITVATETLIAATVLVETPNTIPGTRGIVPHLPIVQTAGTQIEETTAGVLLKTTAPAGNPENEGILGDLVALIKVAESVAAITQKSHLMACRNLKLERLKVIANLSPGRVEGNQVLPLLQNLAVNNVAEQVA